MLKQIREKIVRDLWTTYSSTSKDMQLIEPALKQKGITKPPLDHFALIDLPGPRTGIPVMKEMLAAAGFVTRGQDYLPDKQNDFLWMAEPDSEKQPARDVLPQIVVADFRPSEMPENIKSIILKYSSQAAKAPLEHIHRLANQAAVTGNLSTAYDCASLIVDYLTIRGWPLPTVKEFYAIREFNELLAWVLVFGRRPNHFTLSIHLMEVFGGLAEFHQFIQNEVSLQLNQEGGTVKGGKASGIAQGSTAGLARSIRLADGEITLPVGFVEFVWRYPEKACVAAPILWGDYFTGFVAPHADRVIESLYIPSDHVTCG